MGEPKKAGKFLLISGLAGVGALCLVFWPAALALLGLCFSWAPLSAPFCLLQMALCRRCPYQILRAAPAALSGVGVLYGLVYAVNAYEWASLMGLVILLPSLLALGGSGLGWLLWRLEENKKSPDR